MEMPEGWKRLFTKKMIARASNWNDDVEVFENTLNLMKEMAEALEKIHRNATEGQNQTYKDTNNVYLKIVTGPVLKKFKEWK